ncbi:MAG: DivIVA domain-containing protein [Oscillospiraceae bacterium]|jgi:cell division septum initiation protein DivIVA|nr:DivIVA domain-containing protein [Oscillospiraceae bacterium]
MSVTMEFFDGITFDIAKQKYYNANKVDARMEEIKAAFAELIEENNELRRQINDVGLSKERVAELIMGAQAKADEMIKDANAKAEEIISKAKLDADGIVVSRKASDGGEKTLGLTQNQLAAIDKLNKQLDDFNVAQATQIFRIKQALMGIALDK